MAQLKEDKCVLVMLIGDGSQQQNDLRVVTHDCSAMPRLPHPPSPIRGVRPSYQ